MSQFAVIKTGGKQYFIEPGTKLKIEKLDVIENGPIIFDQVLLIHDGTKTEIGTPFVAGAKIEAHVLKQGRAKKIIVFHYHSKTRHRKKAGHRPPFTEIEIKKIMK